jgi:ubiquinone biosynthesis protein UbiJ
MGVVLGQLHAQASGLDADGGVTLRVESGGSAEDLGGDLVLLQGYAGMIQRMFGEVAEELAERLGGVEAMTINKFIYLLEALLPANSESVRHSHITGR